MHRGTKGRSRGGGRGRGGEGSRGGREGSMLRGHGLNQNVRREAGSNDSLSFCAGAANVQMASTQRSGRGGRGRVGSKGRGTFVSTVGSKSFR